MLTRLGEVLARQGGRDGGSSQASTIFRQIIAPVSVGGLALESQRTTIHSFSTPLMSTTLKVMRLSSASKTREPATGKTLVRNV